MRQPTYLIIFVLIAGCMTVSGEFVCPPGAEGFFAPEGQCSPEYYACINGVAYLRSCPDGEVFDPANKHCVPYEQASCRDLSTTTTTPGIYNVTTTTMSTTTPSMENSPTTRSTTTTKPSGVFTCPAPDGFFPIPGACSSEYYVCIANFPYLTKCPNGNIFDPVTLVCTSPDQASCTAVFTCPYPEGFFPVPGACSSEYYACVGGVPTLTECPAGAIFDPQEFKCVPPENASCSV